jgi:hypothetical protein
MTESLLILREPGDRMLKLKMEINFTSWYSGIQE